MVESQPAQLQTLLSDNIGLLPFEEEADQGELVDYEEEPPEVLSPRKQQESERSATERIRRTKYFRWHGYLFQRNSL